MIRRIFWVVVRIVGLVLSPIMAAGMTLGLFYFMQSLISSGAQLEQRVVVVKLVDASMPEIDMVVIEEIDKPEPIAEVSEEQPELQEKQVSLDQGPSLNIARAEVEISTQIDISIASIAATDGDYLPLVAISPQYPERARARDIEGWCLVSFTVDSLGGVVEGSIEVVDSEPPSVFDRSAMQAASRFKFQPRVKDGVGVEVPGVQYLFRFMFED